MISAATPITAQNMYHGVPAPISGPTTNWPADPPAMPNICVAPINVAARDGGKARRRDVDRADKREDAADTLEKPPDAGQAGISGREHQRADADRGGADRHDPARAETIDRRTRNQAERRVAPIEEAEQRRDRGRAHAEGFGELRHHHRGRRSQRVLVEVVHRRDQPRDDRR